MDWVVQVRRLGSLWVAYWELGGLFCFEEDGSLKRGWTGNHLHIDGMALFGSLRRRRVRTHLVRSSIDGGFDWDGKKD